MMEYTLIDPKEEQKAVRHELSVDAYRDLVFATAEHERVRRLMKLKGPEYAETRRQAREVEPELSSRVRDARALVSARAGLEPVECATIKRSAFREWVRDLEMQHLRLVEQRKGVKGDQRQLLDVNLAIIEDTLGYAKKELAKL